jgi:hypothetical protein
MSAANLCEELARRGVTLSLVPSSGRLSLEGDAAALDARVLADVRAMKPEIMALLEKRETRYNAAPLETLARESSREETEPAASTREVREFDAGAAYDPTLATAEAWRQWEAGEVSEAQFATLLSYARAAKPP